MTRILSGMQPTGNLHLGNYLGALRNWVRMQDSHECFYCVVDLHAITVPQDPQKLRQSARETAAAYIASGIDTSKSTLFVQSAVPAHTELSWILATQTPLGWLNRMTQFKEKAAKSRDLELLGLYAYPVLMAADILIYKATHVPVGEDQKQHLELTRDVAVAFNRAFGQDYFPLPEPLILGDATRVMSLRDGTKKMSKSDESDYSRINLTDDADAIALKFRKAKTDAAPFPETIKELETRPEADNLVAIYAALADQTRQNVLTAHAGAQFSAFKTELTELAVSKLSPITATMRELLADPAEIDRILTAGAAKANALTQKHIREIRDLVGLWAG
jgi:tryptophanyl-tRNA synthetase